MKNQTRLLIIAALVFVLAVSAVQFIWRGSVNLTLPEISTRSIFKLNEAETKTEPEKIESVMIDFGNGKTVKGKVSTQNAYQALAALAAEKNLSVETKQYKYGLMVTKIGDTASSGNSGWTYTVNGKPGQIASDRYIIYPGDIIEWKFTKF